MKEHEVRSAVIEELDNLGIFIDEDDEDVGILSMGIDSITFISFIVAIEDRFAIKFPDDSLTMDVLNSLNGFTSLVFELLK